MGYFSKTSKWASYFYQNDLREAHEMPAVPRPPSNFLN